MAARPYVFPARLRCMKTTIWIFALLTAFPLLAGEPYHFHVSITSTYEALGVINPRFQKRAPATTREEYVLLFSHGEGGRWKTVIGPCQDITRGQSEVLINASGAACRKDKDDAQDYDAAFRVDRDGDLTMTCLRDACTVHFEKGDRKGDFSLKHNASARVPIDSDVTLTVKN